jgi:hypothetical protein
MAAYSIRSSLDDQAIVTVRIGPVVTLDKARALQLLGWEFQIIDAEGRSYDVKAFEQYVASAQSVGVIA